MEAGISYVSYYRGGEEFGVLRADQAKWLTELVLENARLMRQESLEKFSNGSQWLDGVSAGISVISSLGVDGEYDIKIQQ